MGRQAPYDHRPLRERLARRVRAFVDRRSGVMPDDSAPCAAAPTLFYFLLSLSYLAAIALFFMFVLGPLGLIGAALFFALFYIPTIWRWTRYTIFPLLLIFEHFLLFFRVLPFHLVLPCVLSGLLVAAWFVYLVVLPESQRVDAAAHPAVRRRFSVGLLFLLLWPLSVCSIAPVGLLAPRASWAWLLLTNEILMLAVTAGGAALVAVLMSGLDAQYAARRWFATFCFSLPFIIFAAAYIDRYLVSEDCLYDRICAQPSVTPIYSYQKGLYSSSALRFLEVRNIVEGCRPGVYYLTTARRGSEVIELDTAARTTHLLEGARPNEGIDVACEGEEGYAYIGGDRGVLLKIDLRTRRAAQTAASSLLSSFKDIRLVGGGRWLLTLKDSPTGAPDEEVFSVWDTKDLTRVLFVPGELARIAVREDMVFIRKRGSLHGYGFDGRSGAVQKRFEKHIDLAEFPQLATHGHITAHSAAPYVYYVGSGNLYALDPQTGEPVFRREVALGLRFLSISPDGKLIASASHGDRRLYFFDSRTGAPVASLLIGKKGGWVRFTRDGKYALVPSKAGGFKVRLPEAPGSAAEPAV